MSNIRSDEYQISPDVNVYIYAREIVTICDANGSDFVEMNAAELREFFKYCRDRGFLDE